MQLSAMDSRWVGAGPEKSALPQADKKWRSLDRASDKAIFN